MSGWLFHRPSQPKRSVISRTEESELKRSQRTAEELLGCAQKLQKDAKKCTDALTVRELLLAAASKTEIKLAENLASGPLGSGEEFGKNMKLWVQRLHIHENRLQELNGNMNKTVVEPMKRFSSISPGLQNAVKERDKCVQELNRCQAKVEKYQDRDRTGPNIVKLDTSKKQLAAAKDEYNAVNQPLQQDLPKLYASRVEYMDPCMKGLVWSQDRYFDETHKLYDYIQQEILKTDQDSMLDENYEKRLQTRMDEIRALSIVVEKT